MGAALSSCGFLGKKPQKKYSPTSDGTSGAAEGNSLLASLKSYMSSKLRRRPAKSKHAEPESLQAFHQSSETEVRPSRLQGALFSLRSPWKNSSKVLKTSPPISILQDNAAYRSLSRSEQADTEGHIIILNVFHAISSLERSYMAHFVQVAPSDDPYIRSLTQWTDANKRVMLNTFEYLSKLKADYMDKVCKGAGAREFSLPRSLTNPFDNTMVRRKVMQLENMVSSRDMELRMLRDKFQKDDEDHKRLIFQLSRSLERREVEKKEEQKLTSDRDNSGNSSNRDNSGKTFKQLDDVLERERRIRIPPQDIIPQTEITEIEEVE